MWQEILQSGSGSGSDEVTVIDSGNRYYGTKTYTIDPQKTYFVSGALWYPPNSLRLGVKKIKNGVVTRIVELGTDYVNPSVDGNVLTIEIGLTADYPSNYALIEMG